MRMLLGVGLVLALACGVTLADDKKDGKIDAKKLVGKWEPKDAAKKDTGFVIEFTKDGKVSLTSKAKDKDFKADGTYKLDGDKLTLDLKFGGDSKSMTRTITKLTDTELASKDEGGKEDTLVRIKDAKKEK